MENFQWDDLFDFKLKPPFIPQVEDYTSEIFKNFNSYENQINVSPLIFKSFRVKKMIINL